MLHHLNSLSITEKLYEAMQDGGRDLGFAAIESNLATYTENYAAWHWHDAMELGLILDGAVDCHTPGAKLTLRPGEGYFVNAGVLHMNRIAAGSREGRLRVMQFDAALISSSRAVAERYVIPIEKRANLECVPLLPGDPASGAVLRELALAFDAAASEPCGYELEVVQRLLSAWRGLYERLRPALSGAAPAADTAAARLKAMLAYIHSRFDAPMSVAEIAAAVNISEREAYRTFKQVLGTTPTLYIQQYRVNVAAQWLLETDRPVTDISMDAGFSSPNYFNRVFRDLMGTSPRQFRRDRRRA